MYACFSSSNKMRGRFAFAKLTEGLKSCYSVSFFLGNKNLSMILLFFSFLNFHRYCPCQLSFDSVNLHNNFKKRCRWLCSEFESSEEPTKLHEWDFIEMFLSFKQPFMKLRTWYTYMQTKHFHLRFANILKN